MEINQEQMLDLETERLRLRLWAESDFSVLQRFFSDEELAGFVGGTKSPEECWRLLATYIGHYHLRGYSYLAIEEKATGEIAGSIGLWDSMPWPELELGYWLLREKQGLGFATEAGKMVRDYAFGKLDADTLASYIHQTNKASIRLAERLGATYETDIEWLDFGPHRVYRYLKTRLKKGGAATIRLFSASFK